MGQFDNMQWWLACSLIFLCWFGLGAQPHSPLAIELATGYARVMPTDGFVMGNNTSGQPYRHGATLALTVVRRTNGAHYWHRVHGRPSTGFGLRRLWLEGSREIGRPWALYRYYRAPLLHRGILSLDYQAGIGIAAGWRPYDPDTNPFNEMMGTRAAAYVELGVEQRFHLARQWEAHFGLGFMHASNGNLDRPNAGANLLSAKLGFAYQIAKNNVEHPAPTTHPPPGTNLHPRMEYTLALYTGVDNRLPDQYWLLPEKEQQRALGYRVVGLTLDAGRRISPSSRLGLGLTALYHEGATATVTLTDERAIKRPGPTDLSTTRLSVHPYYELIFHRISILAHLEVRIANHDKAVDGTRVYQRLGLRYRINPHLFTGITVNSQHFSQAKFIEWQVGVALGATK